MSATPILLYHSISDHPLGDFGPYTLGRERFASHLDRIQALGFETRTIAELVRLRSSGTALPERTVVITVDDGFADFAEHAWPELQDRSLASTLYVTAGTVGGRSRWLDPLRAGSMGMLDAGQIRDLHASGCEIGAHSMSHPQLDCLPRDVARQEIVQSKDVLEQLLGHRVDSFAYPHGFHDRVVKELVREAGYGNATAVRNALSPADDDPWALARITIMSDVDDHRLEQLLLGRGVPTATRREQLRTTGWRQVRRLRSSRHTAVQARLERHPSTAVTTEVVDPAPRDEWRAVLAGDTRALPEHAPEWVDAVCATGPYRDASRLYDTEDGRQFVLPLVRRTGPAGTGGWLQSFPPAWGIGGVVGAGLDVEVVGRILADLRATGALRIGIRPDPLRYGIWAKAADASSVAVTRIPRRAHVLDLEGGPDAVFARMSQSGRRGIRLAERAGVRVEVDRTGELLDDYYRLYLSSLTRWAARQNEPVTLARLRGTRRDPLEKLKTISSALGKNVAVALAYRDDVPVAGTITLLGQSAHYTRGAMDAELVGNSHAPDLLQWHLLQLACELGCEVFHLGESGSSASLAQYKEKLGARAVDYAEFRLERLPYTRVDRAARTTVKKLLRFRDA